MLSRLAPPTGLGPSKPLDSGWENWSVPRLGGGENPLLGMLMPLLGLGEEPLPALGVVASDLRACSVGVRPWGTGLMCGLCNLTCQQVQQTRVMPAIR